MLQKVDTSLSLRWGSNNLQHRQFFLFAETSAECFCFLLRAAASCLFLVSTDSPQCEHFSLCSSASPALLLKDVARQCVRCLADTGDNFTLTNLWLWEKSSRSNAAFRRGHCLSISPGSPAAFATCTHNVITEGEEGVGRRQHQQPEKIINSLHWNLWTHLFLAKSLLSPRNLTQL